MNEPSLYGQERSGQLPHDSAGQAPAAPYKFSPEELRVLKECNSESFFQRSLPLGTMFGLGAYFGVQQGHFKPNPRFGAFPKVTLAVIVGYFLGKLSYQQACADKLMALPGSYIGQLLKEKKEGKFSVSQTPAPPTMFGASPGDIYSDAGPGNSLDLDTDRPLFSEETYNATSDYADNGAGGSLISKENIAAHEQPRHIPSYGYVAGFFMPRKTTDTEVPRPRTALSYDELRQRNRGEYKDTRNDPYRVETNDTPVVTRSSPRTTVPRATNKYGDEME